MGARDVSTIIRHRQLRFGGVRHRVLDRCVRRRRIPLREPFFRSHVRAVRRVAALALAGFRCRREQRAMAVSMAPGQARWGTGEGASSALPAPEAGLACGGVIPFKHTGLM